MQALPAGSHHHPVAPYPDRAHRCHRTVPAQGPGDLAGAVNLLMDVSEERKPEYLRAQAARCRRLAAEMTDLRTIETMQLMAAKYDEQARRYSRLRAGD